MAKIIIMKGLPASGKSTRAKEIMRTDGNAIRLNKDLMREMLHFNKFTGKNEGKTKDATRELARYFLSNGTNVIIDDTNLNPRTLDSWKGLAIELGAKIQYENLTAVPMEECIANDLKRKMNGERFVGRAVISNMALQYGLYNKPPKGFVICDIDGTVAEIQHRRHFVDGPKKDWKSFFEAMVDDTPREDVRPMIKQLQDDGHLIIFVSSRPEMYRKQTEFWLDLHFGEIFYLTLIMRKDNDSRPDTEVKKDIYDLYFKDKYEIDLVVDDRPSVIRMWREQGLKVEDVGNGIEF